MKNYNDIINRFDDIEDLPISEEMLGAYLEEKISDSELETLESYKEESPIISEIIKETNDFQISIDDSDIDNYETIEYQEMQDFINLMNFDTTIPQNDVNHFSSDLLDTAEMQEKYNVENENINNLSK